MEVPNKPDPNSKKLFMDLASFAVSHDYANNAAIFLQDDAADAIFRVEAGHVKLTVRSDRGKKVVLAVLGVGECFGESCLAGALPRPYTATSIRESTVGRVGKRVLTRQLREEPAFAKLFTAHLLRRIGRVEDDLIDQLVNTSERRLARLLLQLSDFGNPSWPNRAPVSVDQGTLAQAVGTTRSRVSHFMNEFRKQGYIDYNGSIHVHQALLSFFLREPTAK